MSRPLARTARRRRSRRGSRSGGDGTAPRFHIGDEFFNFSVALGATQNISLGNISTKPAQCNIRPLFIAVTAMTAYVPALGSDALPGYFTPSALDVQLTAGPSGGDVIATSRPQVLGMNPRAVIARYPRSGDWYPYNKTNTVIIARINAVCLGNPGNTITGYIRGTVHLRYQFSYEILTATCPTTCLCDTDPLSAEEPNDDGDDQRSGGSAASPFSCFHCGEKWQAALE